MKAGDELSGGDAIRKAILRLAGSVAADADQARAMTDLELGELLAAGRWTTIEVHEAARRLIEHGRKAGRRANAGTGR